MSQPFHFTKLIIVRHGQARAADGGYGPDTPLSELGREQARLVAEALRGHRDIAKIYSSPFIRAIATARPIEETVGMEATIDGRLAELQIGTAPLDRLIAGRNVLKLWRPEHRGAEGCESVEEFFTRVGEFCDWACARHRDEKIILVTHGGTLDAIFRWAMGIPASEPWSFGFEVPNASISEIEAWPFGRSSDGPPRHSVLYRVGEAVHLAGAVSDI